VTFEGREKVAMREREQEPVKTLHATVRGLVQMVGFRQFVWMRARGLGLTGYVRNSDDGENVAVVAEGPAPALEELLRHLHRGPFMARVDEVEVSWSDESGNYQTFDVAY
jgi:acylphosphatase